MIFSLFFYDQIFKLLFSKNLVKLIPITGNSKINENMRKYVISIFF